MRQTTQAVAGATMVGIAIPPEVSFDPYHTTTMGPHISLMSAGWVAQPTTDAIVRALRMLATTLQPFEAVLGGLGHFHPPDRSVAYVHILSPAVLDLHAQVAEALAVLNITGTSKAPNFVPHATVATMPRQTCWAGPVPSGSFTARALTVWRGSQTWTIDFGPGR